ncbi:MAG: hypothetical protein A2W91_14845 [Bacteroidetes bacterium GWF2_38_335]|nr:MAG: hypothetical protein A2W91_14845 [Bacteroidetes bacterium GWF2_38_335]OFY78477.1 MAG: hypothetical protein A2281_16155 [Bacteroidetes bacterium RIFOXYA12_FULL_38_20]HBS88426.1 peptidase M13 [Bacteroidales bacterium]
MKKYIILSLCLPLFIACNETAEKSKKENEKMKEEKILAINPADLDKSVSPGEDFNQFANGGWMKNNPMPSDKSRYGAFDQLADVGQKQVRALIEDLSKKKHKNGTDQYKIGLLYSMGMDSAKIESDGLKAVQEELAKIDGLATIEDIQKHIALLHKQDISPLFNIYADADSKNSTMVLGQLSQGGIGLPEREYYLGTDESSKGIIDAYKNYIAKIFDLTGTKNGKEIADKIFSFEYKLAKASMKLTDRRDPHKTYNKMTVAQLSENCPEFDWKGYFSIIGLDNPGEVNVGQPDFFKAIGKMQKEIPVETWKLYLKWNYLRAVASYLNDDFVNETFSFYGKTLSGVNEIQPRWKRVVNIVNSSMSESVGKLYVEKHFPPKAKEKMLKLVANLKSAFADRIKNLDWMSDETKQKALQKLEKINVKVGYPDKWRDYSALEIKNDYYVMNVLRANEFEFKYMIGKINKPVNKEEWFMPPQMVNAYYEPSMNEIVFPAAILQPPFFYLDADDAVNYGAIGVVIGHEMTHGFDDQGKKYDLNGNLNNWWTDEDVSKFDAKSKVLVDQFNSYVVLDNVHANGEFTLGENIADLGGLCISYTALQKVLKENPVKENIDGFTPEQRFFLAYAHVWAQNIKNEEILRRTKEDPHSLGKLRVNGPLPNIQEFYEAFNITENDKMFIPVESRAKIW